MHGVALPSPLAPVEPDRIRLADEAGDRHGIRGPHPGARPESMNPIHDTNPERDLERCPKPYA